jgi:hypothetical protein
MSSARVRRGLAVPMPATARTDRERWQQGSGRPLSRQCGRRCRPGFFGLPAGFASGAGSSGAGAAGGLSGGLPVSDQNRSPHTSSAPSSAVGGCGGWVVCFVMAGSVARSPSPPSRGSVFRGSGGSLDPRICQRLTDHLLHGQSAVACHLGEGLPERSIFAIGLPPLTPPGTCSGALPPDRVPSVG